MKKAIITGSTGLVGMTVAKYLSRKGIDVLCLGRNELSIAEVKNKFDSDKIAYLSINMKDVLSLPDKIKKSGWESGDSCVFYNFAWSGRDKLTDGDFQDQFNNAVYTSNALLSAKRIGCTKFINAGTLEETFAERFIADENNKYNFSQVDYAIAKLASRDMCKMVAYLEKIDYIHTRLSVPLDQTLSKGGYISSVLRKIANGETYNRPQNPQLFDIILSGDVAKAYYLIGNEGQNKADYYIGTAEPRTLSEYFEIFEQGIKGSNRKIENRNSEEDSEIFSIDNLMKDTGFMLSNKFEDLINTTKGA